MHVREIAEKLHRLDPTITVEGWKAKLSPALSALKQSGVIVKEVVGKSNLNTFWGAKQWKNEDGKIIEGYEYDEKQISSGRSEEITI